MSIFCYTVSPDSSSVIILTDGIATRNGEPYSSEHRKVFKVNSRLGYVWLGSGSPDMLETIHNDILGKGLDTPKQVANHLSSVIDECLRVSQKVRETTPIMAVVFGYSPELTVYKIWSVDGHEPVKETSLRPGDSGGYSYNKDGGALQYPEYLVTRFWPQFKPDLFRACVAAFHHTVSELKEQNIPVGGQFYSEIIKS